MRSIVICLNLHKAKDIAFVTMVSFQVKQFLKFFYEQPNMITVH